MYIKLTNQQIESIPELNKTLTIPEIASLFKVTSTLIRSYLKRAKSDPEQNLFRKNKEKERLRKWWINQRKEVLSHYTNDSNGKICCSCCGEEEMTFLALDHVNDDGAKHRKMIGGGGNRLLLWIRDHDYPPGFQILCHNCNFAKKLGDCPHKIKSSNQ